MRPRAESALGKAKTELEDERDARVLVEEAVDTLGEHLDLDTVDAVREVVEAKASARVERLLVETGLPPRCLEIELTESVLQTGPQTIEAVRALHRLGVSESDFGEAQAAQLFDALQPAMRLYLDATQRSELTSCVKMISPRLPFTILLQNINGTLYVDPNHTSPELSTSQDFRDCLKQRVKGKIVPKVLNITKMSKGKAAP